MKKRLLVIVLAATVAGFSGAQAATAPDEAGKAPRSVFFAPAPPASLLDSQGNTLLGALPDMLAAAISGLQPIARSTAAEAAQASVTVAASAAAGGGVRITISLREGGTEEKTSARAFKGRSLELDQLRGLVEDTASQFAPLLGPVDVLTDIQALMKSREFIETTRQMDYQRELDKRWEFSLWASGILRIIDSTSMDSNGPYYFTFGPGPLIAEATWFFRHDMGVQLSFYFNKTDAFDFGGGSRGKASGIFLFPGVGFVFRTVGQVSMEFTATLSAGLIYVSADNGDVKDRNNNIVIPSGSSAWSEVSPRLRLSPALVWCITPSIALKAGIAIEIIPPNMFPWYDSPIGDMQFLNLGAAVRL